MGCPDYRPLLQRHVDGELPKGQTRLLKDHLPGCDTCRMTVRLLKMEDRAIRGALLGPGSARAPIFGGSGALKAAILIGVFAGLSLVVLYGAYRGVERGIRVAADDAALDGTVCVDVTNAGLPDVLTEVSRQVGMPIRLDPARAAGAPDVTLRLFDPIRLRSFLGLLEDFYGLTPRFEDGVILLR